MRTLLEAKNVGKVYRSGAVDYTALNGVNLSVQQGDFLALCGPSGSGKTTLLNLLGALDNPTTGEVTVGDRNARDLDDAALAKLRRENFGFIFQTFNLVPVLSALENVQLPLIKKGLSFEESQKLAQSALVEVGLQAHLKHYPSQMSGGQRQRVAIARALAPRPLIILADEPTANLDHKTAGEILDIMQMLNQRHQYTFVFSTHDPEIMTRARRLIHLRDGKVLREEVKP